jgi:transcriptional regulator with XRE-family HTH domain
MARSKEYRRALPTLRELRRRRGLPEGELAASVGISGTFLRSLERGATTASPDVQLDLARALGVGVDGLFEEPIPSQWFGVNEASRDSGIHRKTIRKALEGGELRGLPPAQHTGSWKIARTDFEAWVAKVETRRAPVRNELLSNVAPCGSPGCLDLACDVPNGQCHRDGCDEPAALAGLTRMRHRAVAGMPTLYCTSACSLLAMEEHSTTRRSIEFREWLERESLVDVEEAARRLDRSRAVVVRFALIYGFGRRFPGFHWNGAWAFSDDDLSRLAKIIETTPRGELHRDAQRRGRWYEERFKSTKMWGGLAPRLAGKHGKKVGAPPRYTARQAKLVLRLKDEHLQWGRATIARRVNELLPDEPRPLSEKQVRDILSNSNDLALTPF